MLANKNGIFPYGISITIQGPYWKHLKVHNINQQRNFKVYFNDISSYYTAMRVNIDLFLIL